MVYYIGNYDRVRVKKLLFCLLRGKWQVYSLVVCVSLPVWCGFMACTCCYNDGKVIREKCVDCSPCGVLV